MNKSKKMFIITLTFLMLLGLTTIVATDTGTNDTTTITQTSQTNTIDTPTETTQTKTITDNTKNINEGSKSQTYDIQETLNDKSGEKTGNLKASRIETVTNFNDLRTYLTSSSYDTVTINMDDNIQLEGNISVHYAIKNLTINGNGKTIDGNGQYQFLDIYASNTLINNITIINCNATYGGAISLQRGNITINNADFRHNTANYGGAIYGLSANIITITQSNFTNNNATWYGGAIDGFNIRVTQSNFTNNNANTGGAIEGYNEITIMESNLSYNNANFGGAIYGHTYSNITITDSNFIHNNANKSGGSISGNRNSTITITQSNLTHNNASQGGAIYAYTSSTITVTNSTLNNNIASKGGAILGEENSNITLINSNLTHNTATIGGAIYANQLTLEIKDSLFDENTANVNSTYNGLGGGAIYSQNSTVTINNGTFTGNNAKNTTNYTYSHGGAIYVHENSTLTITGTNITSNYAESDGGAIYGNDNSNITITNSNLANNTATRFGGAIYGYDYTIITINNIQLTNNNAGQYGGAIFTYGNMTVTNSNLTHNNASHGGAIHGWSNSSITIYNTQLTNNYVGFSGGAIDNLGNLTVFDSIFKDNFSNMGNGANAGGSAIFSTDYLLVNNTTFDNNSGDSSIRLFSNINVTINNSIFIKNNAQYDGGAIDAGNTGGNCLILNSTFISNSGKYGGAIMADSSLTGYNNLILNCTIINSTFENNLAENGGAIYFENPKNLIIINSSFKNNYANTSGGAIYGRLDANLSIINSNLTNNYAESDGGAIYSFLCSISIINSNITHNNAIRGGAIYDLTNSKLILKDSNISNNYVTSNTGYVIDFGTSNSIIITDNIFINNTDNTRDMLFSDTKKGSEVDIHGNTYIDNFLEDNIRHNVTVGYNESDSYTYDVDIILREIYNDTVRNGTLNVYVNGILKNTTEVLNGTSRISLENSDLTKRENNITLEYISLSKHYQNTTTSFIIYKEPSYSVVTVDSVEGIVLDYVTFTANVRDYQDNKVNGGYVVFKVGGKTLSYDNGTQIRTPVENGIAKLSYMAESGWIVDTHPNLSVEAVFSGTSLVSANRSDTNIVTIYKRNATVTVSAPDDYVNGTLHIDAVVRDQNGSLINGGVLVFKLNGLSLKDENNKGIIAQVSNGRVHLDVKLPFAYSAKKYNLTATYSNKIYNKATGTNTTSLKAIPTYVNASVTIKDQFSKPVVTGQIYNKFNNAILEGTAVINIKFDGISYAKKVKVNNGTFRETLEGIPIYKPGTHKVEVVAGANSHYEAVRKTYTTKATPKYNVTTVFTNITRNKTTTRVQAKIVDDINKNVQRNLTVTIKLNGKSFLINRTVTNGNVDVLIDTSTLKNRTYNLELVSGANTYYNAGKSTTELPKY